MTIPYGAHGVAYFERGRRGDHSKIICISGLHHDPPNMGIVTGIWIFIIVGRGLMLIYEGEYWITEVRRIVE